MDTDQLPQSPSLFQLENEQVGVPRQYLQRGSSLEKCSLPGLAGTWRGRDVATSVPHLFSGLATAMWSVLRKMHQGSWVDCSCHQAPIRLPGTQQLSRAGIDLSPKGAWSWA